MKDMTQGSIIKHIIGYAVPMILGNILQLTYNAADSMIIGKYLGENALAAVSTSNPIMTIMVLGASGIGIGASVIMGKLYGAKDEDGVKREYATTLISGTVLSLLVFCFGILMTPQILSWIRTPEEAMEMAVLYLRIIFVGFLFTFQYNILSHAMRSIGDSRTPVLFLGISCGLNILLDLILIAGCSLGVAGAALATTLSEGVSVILCLVYIQTKIPLLHLGRGEYKIDRALLSETFRNGMLTALQQAAQPIGKVMIQRTINLQGVTAIGAFNAVCRVDDFACIPSQSIGSGVMTCTAQNRGAKNEQRMRKSLSRGLIVALCYFPMICSVTLLFRGAFVRFLTPDESTAMVEMGAAYLAVKAWFFIMPCILNSLQGYFRGLGHMAIVLAATVMQISIRTLCVILWVPKIGITGEAYACMAGWGVMLIYELICLGIVERKRIKRQENR